MGTQKLSLLDPGNPQKGISLEYTTQDWCGDLYVGVKIDHLCDPNVPAIQNVQVIPFEGNLRQEKTHSTSQMILSVN